MTTKLDILRSHADQDPSMLPHEAIASEGGKQIAAALQATNGLVGDELNRALTKYYEAIEPQGLEAIDAAMASGAAPAIVIEATPHAESLSREEREWQGAARLLFVARHLGTVWTRHYEQDGEMIQHVAPEKGFENTQSSKGMLPLKPHGEILPAAGMSLREARPKYTMLYAVANSGPGTPTTLFATAPAIAELSAKSLAVLQEPRFTYLGTDLERLDSESPDAESAAHTNLAVLYPSTDASGTSYDVVVDFDTETMTPQEGDAEAQTAFTEFLDRVLEQEVALILGEGQILLWPNRTVLHGRKYSITNPDRELLRVQVGEADQSTT